MRTEPIEVGCTYTDETELLFCSMNMDYTIENHVMTIQACTQTGSLFPFLTHVGEFFQGSVTPVVHLKIHRKHSTTISLVYFSQPGLHVLLSFFSCIFTRHYLGELAASRDNQIHEIVFLSCCSLVFTFFFPVSFYNTHICCFLLPLMNHFSGLQNN